MFNKTSWRRRLTGIVTLVAIVFVTWAVREWRAPAPETATRAELDLRDGILFRQGATQAFSGLLIEEWKPGRRRTEVAIRDGRAHGLSRGWYEKGQLEVGERFVRGGSHGTRTRWYADGVKKSEVRIRDGQMVGVFREWHPNGRLARETPLEAGVAHGEVRGWDAQGQLAGTALVEHGKLVHRD